jgi:hypothetical protein
MANKTLLDCVNEIFKRVNVNAGDAAALTTLTDSARQHPIDVAVQVINEGIDKVYGGSNKALPTSQKEGTITLATGTRAYALATDLVQLRWPFIDKTNSQFIMQYPGTYNDMLLLDLEQDDTGLPHWGAISPVNGYLHLDRTPTSDENGKVYTYQYDKDLGLSAASDTVPFNNAAFRAMVPAWVQLYKREMRNEFDQKLYAESLGDAARYITELQIRSSYSPR